MKTAKLTDIPGYVPVQQTARYKRELADYRNLKAYIPANVILMSIVVLITYYIARKAFASPYFLVRWVGGVGDIGCGALCIFGVYFVLMLGFYGSPGKNPPGSSSSWIEDYDRDMALLVAGKLIGHEPAHAWHNQISRYVHLVASDEILLLTYTDNTYAAVQPSEVTRIRKITEQEIATLAASKPFSAFLNLDPNAEVMSFILNEPAHHEWGPIGLGPFAIELNLPRPHAIWIARDSRLVERQDERDPINDKLSNDDFMRHLMEVLHPAD